MKVSKVENTRTGIGRKDNGSKGILYVTPQQPDARKDIKAHIEKANEKAKKLYSPFSTVSATEVKYQNKKGNKERIVAEKKQENTIKRQCKDLFKEIAGKRTFDLQSIKSAINSHVRKDWNEKIVNDRFCDSLVNICLRKSLQKNLKIEGEKIYFPDIMKKVVKVIANLQRIDDWKEKEFRLFYDTVYEDYNKEKRIEQLEKSIENNRTKVQVVEKEGEYRLDLAMAQNKKRQYITDFLDRYAGGTIKEQQRLLNEMRRTLLLYVCGEDTYLQAEDVDLMNGIWGGFLPEDHENIDETLYKYIEDGDYTNKLLQMEYHKLLMEHYGTAIRVSGITEEQKQWIGYFNDELEKMFRVKKNREDLRKTGSKYIIKYLWKKWTSFIAGKYIDLGKAVYHFAMPISDFKLVESGEPVAFGKVEKRFQNGLTSFDYERIKAKESLKRNLAVYVTFAAGFFSRATVQEECLEIQEDVLQYKDGESKKVKKEINKEEQLKSQAKRRILQYFGGMSKWKDTDIVKLEDKQLFEVVRKAIDSVRNDNYHYNTERTKELGKSASVAAKLYEKELDSMGYAIRKKYYSNNVPMFYKKKDIDVFMDKLYKRPVQVEAQIPSFGNIFKKADCKTFVNEKISGKLRSGIQEEMEQFYSSFYFIAKEIYYHEFLQLSDLEERFKKALNHVNEKQSGNPKEIENQKKAKEDFKGYIKKYCGGKTFGDICQCIMTEYNQQNQQIKEVKNRKEKGNEIYQHFKMLLYVTLKEAFLNYLLERKEQDYGFLFQPENHSKTIRDKEEEEKFCNGYAIGIYDDIKTLDDAGILAWYITAHFITPKQLNHLQGVIKEYLQYTRDIERRAGSTCNQQSDEVQKEEEYYHKLLKVLEIIRVNAGQVSHEIGDYFEDEEDYDRHVGKYVKYGKGSLREFCSLEVASLDSDTIKEQKPKKAHNNSDFLAVFQAGTQEENSKIKGNQKVGIYYDGTNPILNKNVVYSLMYGLETKITDQQCQSKVKVNKEDISRYYKLKSKLSEVFRDGICKDVKEQKNLREYQNLKNKVELYDVSTYTELLIDCLAQLVSYTYLRERDMMYMQLGFHYKRLQNMQLSKEDKVNRLCGETVNITDGAILYQIVAMYSYHTKLILEKDGVYCFGKGGVSTGGKVGQFTKEIYSADDYEAGLYFFENLGMHDEYTDRRNYIAHMKYLSKNDKSILDLYAEMYNGFFDYDIKLKKSVSYILPNILMRYFIVLDTNMEDDEHNYKVEYKSKDGSRNKRQQAVTEAKIVIKGTKSENFVYKGFKNGNKPLEIPARSEEFCQIVRKLLGLKKQ